MTDRRVSSRMAAIMRGGERQGQGAVGVLRCPDANQGPIFQLSSPTPMKPADLLQRITIRPEQCGGRPCIRGMRIRVIDVLELLAAGECQAQILEDYPYLEADDIAACLLYAARRLNHPNVAA